MQRANATQAANPLLTMRDHENSPAIFAILVDDVQHPVLAAVVGDVLDEVVAPDMPRPLGAQPDA
jgi:hypothetical protein